jgi:hypothetical protein
MASDKKFKHMDTFRTPEEERLIKQLNELSDAPIKEEETAQKSAQKAADLKQKNQEKQNKIAEKSANKIIENENKNLNARVKQDTKNQEKKIKEENKAIQKQEREKTLATKYRQQMIDISNRESIRNVSAVLPDFMGKALMSTTNAMRSFQRGAIGAGIAELGAGTASIVISLFQGMVDYADAARQRNIRDQELATTFRTTKTSVAGFSDRLDGLTHYLGEVNGQVVKTSMAFANLHQYTFQNAKNYVESMAFLAMSENLGKAAPEVEKITELLENKKSHGQRTNVDQFKKELMYSDSITPDLRARELRDEKIKPGSGIISRTMAQLKSEIGSSGIVDPTRFLEILKQKVQETPGSNTLPDNLHSPLEIWQKMQIALERISSTMMSRLAPAMEWLAKQAGYKATVEDTSDEIEKSKTLRNLDPVLGPVYEWLGYNEEYEKDLKKQLEDLKTDREDEKKRNEALGRYPNQNQPSQPQPKVVEKSGPDFYDAMEGLKLALSKALNINIDIKVDKDGKKTITSDKPVNEGKQGG